MIEHVLTWWLERRLEREALDINAEPAPGATWRLRYSSFFRRFWLVQAMFWGAVLGLFVWVVVVGQLGLALLPAVALFGAIFVFSSVMTRDGYTQEIEVSVAGVSELRNGTLVAFHPWASLRRVQFVGLLDSYRLVTESGAAVRFSKHIGGLVRFKWLCRKYAPAPSLVGVTERIADLSRL